MSDAEANLVRPYIRELMFRRHLRKMDSKRLFGGPRLLS